MPKCIRIVWINIQLTPTVYPEDNVSVMTLQSAYEGKIDEM